MARREYAGGAKATTLSSDITAGSTSIAVADATNWPTGTFYIAIARGTASEEKVLCSARSGNTLTVSSRGADGTSAAAHSSGDAVEHVFTATDADEANALVNLADAKGDIVAASAADTWARVAVGSDNQALLAASGQSAGVAWGDVLRPAIADAKGDILVATAADTIARKAVGSNGSLLVADSGQSDGLRYALPVGATIDTEQSTTSTSYTDLATGGPAVTATAGGSGMALVIVGATVYNSNATNIGFVSFAVSGATTLAAADARSALFQSDGAGQTATVTRAVLLTGLSAGSNTFTAKYRVAGGTGWFLRRNITVIPL